MATSDSMDVPAFRLLLQRVVHVRFDFLFCVGECSSWDRTKQRMLFVRFVCMGSMFYRDNTQ